MCVGGTVALKQKSEDNLQDIVLSRYHVVPGIKPGPSNLEGSTFTYGATLPAPAALSYRWILTLPSQLDPQAIPTFCRKKKKMCVSSSLTSMVSVSNPVFHSGLGKNAPTTDLLTD